MRQRVRVAANTAELGPSAPEIAALQAKPEVLLEVALGTVTQVLVLDLLRWPLLEGENVFAGGQLLFPSLDLLFPGERVRLHDGVDRSRNCWIRFIDVVEATFVAFDGQGRVVAVGFRLGSDGKLGHLQRGFIADDHLPGAADVERQRMLSRVAM